jgi:2-phospho-L-lactate guanylyltransferase
MTFWAVVPVKPLRRGKSRLSGVLTQEERTALNFYLLEHTLDTLNATPEIKHILVVSRDPVVLALARSHQAQTVQEGDPPQLNLALSYATQIVQPFTRSGLLILPADLPLITPQDIQGMLEILKKGMDPSGHADQRMVVIAPDRHRLGTNGLLICPPGLIPYHFGPDSFERHCADARQVNARLEIYENPAFALDVDLPEDLNLIRHVLAGLDLKNFVLPDLTDDQQDEGKVAHDAMD